jgi:hypothetical protein
MIWWTDQSFENFILELEWKIDAKGNSGIFYGYLKTKNSILPILQALKFRF